MSLTIVTTKGEKIDGGYIANRLSVFSVGRYDFLTKDLLGVVESLASLSDFANMRARFDVDLSAMQHKLTKKYIELPQRHHLKPYPDIYFLENAHLMRGNSVGLSVNEREFQVGTYVLAGDESRLVLESLVCGGMMGWPNCYEPASAQQCRETILQSRKPFFRELVKLTPRLSIGRS